MGKEGMRDRAAAVVIFTLASILLLSGLWCIYLSSTVVVRDEPKLFLQKNVGLRVDLKRMTYRFSVEDRDKLRILLHGVRYSDSINLTVAPPVTNYSGPIYATEDNDSIISFPPLFAPLVPRIYIYLLDPYDRVIWCEEGVSHAVYSVELASGEYAIVLVNPNEFDVWCFVSLTVKGDVQFRPLEPVGSLLILIALPIFGLGVWASGLLTMQKKKK